MKVLLDTHALLWWLLDDSRLSSGARRLISAAETEVLVSSASVFEIATKYRLGKLWVGHFELTALPGIIADERFGELPIRSAHALAAGGLDGPHRDPFDRILIAQSRLEGVPVVTLDPVFARYDVEVIW
jgi:PIN domain nuclease of toxin-antitoxin system